MEFIELMGSGRFIRFANWLVCLGIWLGVAGPVLVAPTIGAVVSGSTASAMTDCNAISIQIEKTKKQIKKASRIGNVARKRLVLKRLKKRLKNLNRQLAQCLAIPPQPPFIEMVSVGDAPNDDDPEDGDHTAAGEQHFGAVDEAFQIGKYEVTNAQYAAFLIAVAEADPNALYHPAMAGPRGGIARSGSSPNFAYTVKSNMADKPVLNISFWNACRFCNWLHNGCPTGPQNESTTEDGAYKLTPDAIGGNSVMRNLGAKFFLPTEDQWYKAAYHDPRSQAFGGPPGDDNYWSYPTMSDVIPKVATADATGNVDNDDANIANYGQGADWDGQDGNVTTVGSGGPGSASYYGAYDMAGNAAEWNETIINMTERGFRGGSFDDGEFALRALSRLGETPETSDFTFGFRVASPGS